MRIKTLSLKNFRCFELQTFNFAPQFNLLIGDNGSGKTAVLDGLAVAIGSWLLGTGDLSSRAISPEEIRLKAIGHGTDIFFEKQYPVEVQAWGEVMGRNISWTRKRLGSKTHTTHGDADSIKGLSKDAVKLARENKGVILPIIIYYGTGRLWQQPREMKIRNEKQTKSPSRLTAYRNAIDPRTNPKELFEWMRRQSWISFQEKRDSEILQVVKNAIVASVEGAKDISYDAKRNEIIVRFTETDDQPFSNLSDGQRNMIALVGDIAIRMATLNPQLLDKAIKETPGVILIDELDLHLHPKWQRSIVEGLRTTFPQIQFIATSHSPFVIQTLREGELIMLQGQSSSDYGKMSLEKIAEGLMGVIRADVSPRYKDMVIAAKNYFVLLDEAQKSPRDKLEDFKIKLAEQIEPYADNPAYQAFLEMKRIATLGE
jgi:predicted ATP-binding protein involved in virulence